MLRVAEARRWLGLRIVDGDGTRRTDQDRVLGLPPAFGSGMHAGTMPRLAGADPSSIAFDDGQFGGTGGTHCQGVISLGVSVATFGQFGTDVVHHSLDRFGGNPLIAYLFHDDRRSLERACLSGGDSDPLHQERSQFSSVKAQRLPEGGKSPDGIWGNEQPAPPRRKN